MGAGNNDRRKVWVGVGGGFESVSTRMSPGECMGSAIIVMYKIRSDFCDALIISLFRSDWTEVI